MKTLFAVCVFAAAQSCWAVDVAGSILSGGGGLATDPLIPYLTVNWQVLNVKVRPERLVGIEISLLEGYYLAPGSVFDRYPDPEIRDRFGVVNTAAILDKKFLGGYTFSYLPLGIDFYPFEDEVFQNTYFYVKWAGIVRNSPSLDLLRYFEIGQIFEIQPKDGGFAFLQWSVNSNFGLFVGVGFKAYSFGYNKKEVPLPLRDEMSPHSPGETS